MATKMDGPAYSIDYFEYRTFDDVNSVRLLFGERNSSDDIVYRTGVVMSITNARLLANMLNTAVNGATIGLPIKIPKELPAREDIIEIEGTSVQMPPKKHN